MNGMIGDTGRRRGGPWALPVLGLVAMGLLPSAASAASCRARSGPTQAALIELYTSEGCSSCPPADRWLAALAMEPALRGKVVPLALHVDYWDNLGWRDRFAQSDFGTRQRALTAAQGSKTVFTPQVMVNGRTTLNWGRDTAFRQHIAAINAQPAEAELTLEIVPAADAWLTQVQGRLQPGAAVAHAGVFVALYQDGLASQVTAGENAARRLRHERVTRELIGPLSVAADGSFAHPHRFHLPEDARPRDLGVAAFVQDRTNGQVWQALALAACPE
ncbi:MAG: DUF1223 domain-containing protein [Candidatus Contendobacter sp.]|nr:DUF1223 domain-containing protein [Candidatus Contendobacter sp.]MDS4060133.1 DUF1223 domain-containing protein [Candidatus Contendobacter sp.]